MSMVEWKTIEEIGSYFGGLTGKTKEDFEEGNAKYITYMNVFANPSLDSSAVGVVKINDGEKQNKIQKGDILFTGSSETPEETGMSCVVTHNPNGDFYMNSFCFGLRLFSPEQYNLHFLKHLFRSESIRKAIAKTASGVTRFNISKTRFSKIKIPIPSLAQQKIIVEILDIFTSSIENLKEQIAQRRKQYEYYRDKLLDLEGKEGVEMKTLKDICIKPNTIKWGTEPIDKYYNYIDLSSVKIDSHKIEEVTLINKENAPSRAQQIVLKGDVILGTTRPTLKRYCHILSKYNNQICSTGYCVFRVKSNIVLSRWLFHNIGCGKFWDYCELKQQGAGYPCLSNQDAFAYSIPIPSIQEQERIVSILDTFEETIRNLEAQLKQRQKQYEYYRNKLLTFE